MLQMSDKLPVENPSPGEEERSRHFTAPPLEEQRSRQFLSPPTFHLSRSASPSPIRDRLSVVTPKFLSRSASPSPRQAIQLLLRTSILGKEKSQNLIVCSESNECLVGNPANLLTLWVKTTEQAQSREEFYGRRALVFCVGGGGG